MTDGALGCRGCHLFSVDSSMGDFVYVACAIKKRILVIRIDASGSLSDVSDITTAEVVRYVAHHRSSARRALV